MMHAASDSDVPSLTINSPSSSSRSPLQPAYYVQSPSCDSHDDLATNTEKTYCPSPSNGIRSHMGSPDSYFSRHSTTSSFSTAATTRVLKGGNGYNNKRYHRAVTEESRLYYNEDGYDSNYRESFCSRACDNFAMFLALGCLVFAVICLVLWGAGRPFNSQIRVESLRVYNLFLGEGLDHTGVPTKLMSTNCSTRIELYNPATFFGIDVRSQQFNLLYSDVTVASGQLEKYYQPSKSKRLKSVTLMGRSVPLYGAGMSFAAHYHSRGGDIPLKLEIEIETVGNIIGKLLKSKRTTHVSCSLAVGSNYESRKRVVTFNKDDSCTFKN